MEKAKGRNANKINEEHSSVIKGLGALVIMFLIMHKNYFIYYKPKAAIAVMVMSAFFIYLMRRNELALFAAIIILIGFLEAVDHHLWKCRPFSWMFAVEDFSGTYEGRQKSKYNKKTGETSNGKAIYEEQDGSSSITMIIHQTGSAINISSFYFNAHDEKKLKIESNKIIVSKTEDNQHFELTCHHGKIGVLKNGGHHGTTVLKLIKKGDELLIEGGYYTNRDSQTRGEFVDLRRINKETKHSF